jgi:lysozyme
MKFSAAGMELLKKSEGFRNRVYLDVAGLPTIGYGHRLLHSDSFPNGIDEPQAANLLACDVRDAEQAVQRMVKVPLTQGQFDALVDFCFNLGAGRLAPSTLLKSLNAGRYDDAAEQLLRWDHAGGQENAGLKARRQSEFDLWRNAQPEQQAVRGTPSPLFTVRL